MTPLCELARKYETDKGGQHFRYGGGDADTNHNYTPVYHEMFGEHRDEVKHVLEIGVHAGSSLRMWKEYFPFAEIVGIDTNQDCLKHIEPRIKVFMADQNNPSQLLAVLANLGEDAPLFDLIVDDGSHEREHQITSLKTLLPFLQPWGYYIVEDLGTGPEESLHSLVEAVLPGYSSEAVKIVGGLGPKVQPHEWLFVVRKD
jgi:trans-aconitate methyltransferase